MKTAFITSEYPHPKVGHAAGIATSIKNLALALVRQGVQVTVFVYQQAEDTVINDKGIEVHLIKQKRFGLFTWFFYRKHIQNYVNRTIKEKQIDIVEAPDWTGITAFMRFRVPLVIRFHGSDAYFCKLDQRKQKFKNFMFEKLALKKASAFIAPTAYAGKETRKIFNLDKKKIKTIHYGLQLEYFNNPAPENYQKNTILYIGTIIRKKGVLELAQIFNQVVAKNPHARLILIGGDAPDIKTGQASTFQLMQGLFSAEAKNQVNYLGKIPYAQVCEEIKQAQVCTFPSFAETLGMVTIEAMALQKPVVNTSIGWAQELIDDGVNGYLVHPSDIHLFAEKILDLLNDESRCLTMGKAARQKVEQCFDIEKLALANLEYYQTVLSQ